MATPQTISCPICKQEHALFYVKHSDSDVTLNYICDRVQAQLLTIHRRIRYREEMVQKLALKKTEALQFKLPIVNEVAP